MHMDRKLLFVVLLLGLGISSACAATSPAGLPNPASVFCEQNGGRLEIRTGADGGQSGACVFPDGSECDEWADFRGECKPGDSLSVTQTPPSAGQVEGADMPASAAGLTLSMLQNAQYHSPDWGDYHLANGIYHRPPTAPGESAEIYATQLWEPVYFGDLNGDGLEDAAVILTTQNGGTGHFFELAAVLNRGGQPENVSMVSLGDRVGIEAGRIEGGVITLDMRVQGPNDPMCCASQPETRRYQLQDDQLVRLP
jgi:putative hemolysin